MREKSEMQSHLATNMSKLEQSVPSRSVESEPENVLNTQSPGRSSRWILPEELETPNRPTSSGLQSPVGLPIQLGPSPQTREYSHPSPCCIPPAQWGDMRARDREEECELFGDVPAGHEVDVMSNPFESGEHQDELDHAAAMQAADSMGESLSGAICVNGNLVRPRPAEEETPSTACRANVVNAPGGVALGRGPPGFGGKSPGSIPSRQIAPPPPPPPPPPAPVPHGYAISTAATYPREWTPLHTRPKATGGGGPPNHPGGGTGTGMGDHANPGCNPGPGGGSNGSGGAQPPGGGSHPGGNPGGNPGGSSTPPGSTPPQQSGGAGNPGGTPPTTPSRPSTFRKTLRSTGAIR